MSNILFYSLDAATLFDRSIKSSVGGAELRAFNVARFLAGIGNEVSFIVDKLSSGKSKKEGVKVYSKNYFRSKKSFFLKIKEIFFFRLFYKNNTPYEFFLKNSEFFFIRPSYVCAFGLTNNTLNAFNLARSVEAKFILFIASDEEVSFNESHQNTQLDTAFKLALTLINHADRLFVQNANQKEKIASLFKRQAELLLNPIDIKQQFATTKEYILWVGKSNSYKNPYLYLDLAIAFPEQKFLMICNLTDKTIFEKIKTNLPTNLQLIEHVAADKIEFYFAACSIFINTSEFEGFPNTFLQAAKYGKPIISFKVNPNNFITESDCGITCNGNQEILKNALQHLVTDHKSYEIKSKNALGAVKKHSISEVGKTLAGVFD